MTMPACVRKDGQARTALNQVKTNPYASYMKKSWHENFMHEITFPCMKMKRLFQNLLGWEFYA